MPRLARRISSSGYYHVILKGNGGRVLFETDSDKGTFLNLLERYGEKHDIKYLAWCLMDNHVHLLLLDCSSKMDKAMHDICGLYAKHYNHINDHVGRVFQNRYTSYAIEDENYLLDVVRYIHQNPLKARISQTLDYRWSSYDDYIRGSGITSTDLILDMLGGVDGFREFCSRIDEETCQKIERFSRGRLTDSEALELAKRILGDELYTKMNRMGKQDRNDCLSVLHAYGIPESQIARITGFGRSIVQRACVGVPTKQ